MVPFRSALALFLSSALLGVGCTGPTQEGRMVPEPPYTVQQELGYNDVIRIGQQYAASSGYMVADVVRAEKVRPNYWRIRFGLAPEGSGKMLDIEFDESQRRVVGATEIGGPAGRTTPGP
jgi:hypothetical protein